MEAISRTRGHSSSLVATLGVLGLLTMGTGVYFMLLRPPLLPEDMRYIGLSNEAPRALLHWISIVFRTWGGFMVGLGSCLFGIAGFFFTRRDAWLRLGVGVGLLFGFGSFLASNIQLHSDFLWFIASLFVVALFAAILLALRPVQRET